MIPIYHHVDADHRLSQIPEIHVSSNPKMHLSLVADLHCSLHLYQKSILSIKHLFSMNFNYFFLYFLSCLVFSGGQEIENIEMNRHLNRRLDPHGSSPVSIDTKYIRYY